MQFSSYDVARFTRLWEVPEKPHCTNCLYAKVGGNPENPTVTCAKGYGKPLTLGSMIRPNFPRQIASAAKCPDYDDMGPACNLGHAQVTEANEGAA